MSLLAAHGLTVRYGDHAALSDASLTLDPGDAVALVGRSGSGKTTLARAICGLTAHEGTLTLDDVPLTRRSRVHRRRIQMIFQDPFGSLNPVHTVRHHLERPLRLHDREDSPADLLRAVGLETELLERRPHALSGGQRQRVAIARALAPGPDLLVADEPTSMLDLTLRLGVLELLRGLRRDRGLCLLLVTHDLDVAAFLADRILVMDGGRIVEEGSPDAVLTDPQHPATRRLVEARRG